MHRQAVPNAAQASDQLPAMIMADDERHREDDGTNDAADDLARQSWLVLIEPGTDRVAGMIIAS
jgi:hypothetical protein